MEKYPSDWSVPVMIAWRFCSPAMIAPWNSTGAVTSTVITGSIKPHWPNSNAENNNIVKVKEQIYQIQSSLSILRQGKGGEGQTSGVHKTSVYSRMRVCVCVSVCRSVWVGVCVCEYEFECVCLCASGWMVGLTLFHSSLCCLLEGPVTGIHCVMSTFLKHKTQTRNTMSTKRTLLTRLTITLNKKRHSCTSRLLANRCLETDLCV